MPEKAGLFRYFSHIHELIGVLEPTPTVAAGAFLPGFAENPHGLQKGFSSERIASTPNGKEQGAATPTSSLCRGMSNMALASPEMSREALLRAPTLEWGTQAPVEDLTPTVLEGSPKNTEAEDPPPRAEQAEQPPQEPQAKTDLALEDAKQPVDAVNSNMPEAAKAAAPAEVQAAAKQHPAKRLPPAQACKHIGRRGSTKVKKPSMYDDGSYWKLLGCFDFGSVARMRAHCKPNKKGVVKASENILKLWKTEKGRCSHVVK